jgi:hypothetical protein
VHILRRNGGTIGRLLVFLSAILLFPAAGYGFQTMKFDHSYHSSTMVDSTRKDYYTLSFTNTASDPTRVPSAFDRSAVGTVHDLTLTFKGDLTDSQILDLGESLHYRKYSPEDFTSSHLDLHKYSYLDHLFSAAYGVAIGTSDFFRADFRNNILMMSGDPLAEYSANSGHLRYSHRLQEHFALSFAGGYETRNYDNDDTADYEESVFSMELSRFFPEKYRYQPISSASRGARQTFSTYPNGLSARKAVDYYTDWSKNPGDPEPNAKYLQRVVRGDLHLSLTGDVRRRRQTAIDHEYQQPQGTFRAAYDAARTVRLLLENTYYQRTYDTESAYYHLFDHHSNRAALSGTYRPNHHWSHIISAANEFSSYDQRTDLDFVLNTISWESFFTNAPHTVTLFLQDSLTRYDQSRSYFSDSDRIQVLAAYALSLTDSWKFHLKDEWIDHDVKTFEDLCSYSYVRNTWNAAFANALDQRNTLELGYRNSRQMGGRYKHQDATEKCVYFSWNASL